MSHQFLHCSYLPFLFSASSKCKFWQPYNFISFGSTFSQWELEHWLINQTHPLTKPSTSAQLSTVSKWTISEHRNQLTLPSWKITLISLKWQWTFADWTLHGTWIIYSVPEAVLVSLWMLLSHHIPILSACGTLEIQSYCSGTALGALVLGFEAVLRPVRSASAGHTFGNIHMWNYKLCETFRKEEQDRRSQGVE